MLPLNGINRWIYRIDDRLIRAFHLFEQCLRRRSSLGDAPFFGSSAFEWTDRLESAHSKIRDELISLMTDGETLPNLHELSDEQVEISSDGKWKAFFFFVGGKPFPASMARCPKTAAALNAIPNIHTAFFSILLPDKDIPLHRGVYSGWVRCHLGVIVPFPATCGIQVRDQFAQWLEGRILIFDDSYKHRVWNHGSAARAVLIIDVPRPLPWPWCWWNCLVIWFISKTNFMTALSRRYGEWERRTLDGLKADV